MPAITGKVYEMVGIRKAYLSKVVTSAFVDVPIGKGNSVAWKTSATTIKFEGDNTGENYVVLDTLQVDIIGDQFSTDIMDIITNPQVNTGGFADEVAMWYVGANADGSIPVALKCEVLARDMTTSSNALVVLRAYVPNCSINPDGKPVSDIKNRAKAQQMFSLRANKTAVDLLDVALGGVPSGGAYYRWALTNIVP